MHNQAYCNGEFVDADSPFFSSKDRGYQLGHGCFETLKVIAGEVQFFDQHYARLQHSTVLLGLELDLTQEKLKQIILELCTDEPNPIGIRITCTAQSAHRGLWPEEKYHTNISITAFAITPIEELSLCVISDYRKIFSPLSAVKTTNYLPAIMAKREAMQYGYDDALLLNERGFVAETTIANIFLEKNGMLITPSVDQGIFPGIMRAEVIAQAKQSDVRVEERAVTIEELEQADKLFVCNVIMGKVEVIEVTIFTEPRI